MSEIPASNGDHRSERGNEDQGTNGRSAEERKDFRSYVSGFGLALVSTLLAFAMVQWAHGMVFAAVPRTALLVAIGVLAFVQMLVHFRCFLHISWRHKREDLHLILFSLLLLAIMVGGTVWIMASLATRMALTR